MGYNGSSIKVFKFKKMGMGHSDSKHASNDCWVSVSDLSDISLKIVVLTSNSGNKLI